MFAASFKNLGWCVTLGSAALLMTGGHAEAQTTKDSRRLVVQGMANMVASNHRDAFNTMVTKYDHRFPVRSWSTLAGSGSLPLATLRSDSICKRNLTKRINALGGNSVIIGAAIVKFKGSGPENTSPVCGWSHQSVEKLQAFKNEFESRINASKSFPSNGPSGARFIVSEVNYNAALTMGQMHLNRYSELKQDRYCEIHYNPRCATEKARALFNLTDSHEKAASALSNAINAVWPEMMSARL